ncbi:hypothetical protein HON22_01815, partial [Candidatus Peregrinibacteria bacterium]|nr:hypothetical protein [Candidatus Peregrinibacteria bacterium]
MILNKENSATKYCHSREGGNPCITPFSLEARRLFIEMVNQSEVNQKLDAVKGEEKLQTENNAINKIGTLKENIGNKNTTINKQVDDVQKTLLETYKDSIQANPGIQKMIEQSLKEFKTFVVTPLNNKLLQGAQDLFLAQDTDAERTKNTLDYNAINSDVNSEFLVLKNKLDGIDNNKSISNTLKEHIKKAQGLLISAKEGKAVNFKLSSGTLDSLPPTVANIIRAQYIQFIQNGLAELEQTKEDKYEEVDDFITSTGGEHITSLSKTDQTTTVLSKVNAILTGKETESSAIDAQVLLFLNTIRNNINQQITNQASNLDNISSAEKNQWVDEYTTRGLTLISDAIKDRVNDSGLSVLKFWEKKNTFENSEWTKVEDAVNSNLKPTEFINWKIAQYSLENANEVGKRQKEAEK